MPLPPELRQSIEDFAADIPGGTLARAARELTEAYKDEEGRRAKPMPGFHSDAHRATYAVVRMPATYAACEHALTELGSRVPNFVPRTLLDLGAGPGSASWAAAATLPTLERVTLVERDAGLIELGKKLLAPSPIIVGAPPSLAASGKLSWGSLRRAEWLQRDLTQPLPEGNWDLVIASYSIGELRPDARASLIARAWKQAGALLLVEPGTHAGFAVIETARRQLIAAGAQLAAPCPHMNQCPMSAACMSMTKDWCHFAARLERSSAHRRAKGGDLSYEDEKFSYVAAAKGDVHRADARIVRHPMRHPGHVQLTLCTAEGLKQQTIGKSAKELYRAAKKSEWGDEF